MTLLLILFTIRGMIHSRLSRRDTSSMSEVVQGSPRKEDMQLERNFMELEDSSKDGMKVVSFKSMLPSV